MDFGRELYVPWRLVEGDVLYRDVASFDGPLSPYWNALWWWMFGGYTGLLVSNFLLLVVLVALLWRLLRVFGDRFAVAAALALFLVVSAAGLGNYNFLAPYAHGVTHGLVLAVAGFALLFPVRGGGGVRRVVEPGALRTTGAGLALGLVLLTKLEPFVAAAPGLAVGLVLGLRGVRRKARRVVLFLVASCVPLLVAVALFARALPPAEALAGMFTGWRGVLAGEVGRLPFYRGQFGLGLDQPLVHLGILARWTLGIAGGIVVAVLVDRTRPRAGAVTAALAFGLTLVVLGLLPLRWTDVARPLPLVVAVLLVLALRRRAENDAARRALSLRIAWCVFSLALLAKILLTAKLVHYGFVLAVPGVLVAVVALLEDVPARARRGGGSGRVVRAAALALLVLVAREHALLAEPVLESKRVEVGEGADRIRTDGRGGYVNRLLRQIDARLPEDATLLVLPEGVMLDYLARRRTPTRHLSFMPPELLIFGEEEILEELRRSPPDAVVFLHRYTPEYGLPYFGRHYGRGIFEWVLENYEVVWSRGDPPFRPGSNFGAALLLPR